MIMNASTAKIAAGLNRPLLRVPLRQFADVRWTTQRPIRRGISPDLAVGIAVALACPIAVAIVCLG
jgi:hypothetical protein